MPSKQTSTSSAAGRKSQAARSGAAARAAATGERDEHYDVISVLYHSLQGAETCMQYLEDARNADDEELVSFFEETRQEHADRAMKAKQLLASRLEGLEGSEYEDEEEEEEDEDED